MEENRDVEAVLINCDALEKWREGHRKLNSSKLHHTGLLLFFKKKKNVGDVIFRGGKVFSKFILNIPFTHKSIYLLKKMIMKSREIKRIKKGIRIVKFFKLLHTFFLNQKYDTKL